MKTIEIRTQEELDALPDKFEKFTTLQLLGGSLYKPLIIRKARESSHVEAWGSSHVVARESSHVTAWESSHVTAWGSSHVVARESSHVEAWGSSHVTARGSSHVVARESSHVVAWESSHVTARESSHVVAGESSHVTAWESSHVVAWESSHVTAWESSHVTARGSSHVVARESSHVTARESSHVEAWGSSHVVARESSHVEARENSILRIFSNENELNLFQQSIAILQDCSPKITHQDDTAQIIKTVKQLYNLQSFLEVNNILETNGKITLYKYVRDDFKDHYSGTLNYEPGNIVNEPNWDPDPDRQCGNGLHLSPTLSQAKLYNSSGKAIACEVELKDIVIYSEDITKVRCRQVTVIGEVKE